MNYIKRLLDNGLIFINNRLSVFEKIIYLLLGIVTALAVTIPIAILTREF